MKSKKSQISWIVVFIIFLIALVILMFYVFGRNKVEGGDDFVSLSIDMASVNQYVDSCFKKSAEESLILAGYQGGRLYNYQADGLPVARASSPFPEGKYSIPFKIDGNNYNMSYGIFGSSRQPPFYPNEDYLFSWYPAGVIGKKYYDGRLRLQGDLPALCDTEGIHIGDNNIEKNFCETYGRTFSIENFLRVFLRNRTIECVNTELVPGYIINLSEAEVDVAITENDVAFYMDLPVSYKSQVSDFEGSSFDFFVRYPVRLKKIHELATHLIEQDTGDIFFDMITGAENLETCKAQKPRAGYVKCMKDGMKVEVLRNSGPDVIYGTENYRYVDVINITDEKSIVNGKPYSFYFAVQNRYPALEYIHDTEGNRLEDMYDIIAVINTDLILTPFGYDPDADEGSYDCVDGKNRVCMGRTYHYYGWKANYDEEFFFDPGNENIIDSREVDGFPDPSWNGVNYKEPSTDLQNLLFFDELEGDDNYNNEWENSEMFLDTGKDANISLDEYDAGPHIVRIKVCDEAGLCDWQDIRILVIDIGNGGMSPFMGEIDPGYIGVEDPFIFTIPQAPDEYEEVYWYYDAGTLYSSGSTVPDTDDVELESSDDQTNNFEVMIETSIYDPYTSGDNPFYEIFNDGYEKENTLLTKIITDTSSEIIQPDDFNLYECLPAFKADDDGDGIPDVAPYPYVNFPGDNYRWKEHNTGQDDFWWDDFRGSHVCCQGEGQNPDADRAGPNPDWGTYESSGTPCYELDYYTCNPDVYFMKYSGSGDMLLDHSPNYYGDIDTDSYDGVIYGEIFPDADYPALIPPLNLAVFDDIGYPAMLVGADTSDIDMIYEVGPLNAIYRRTFSQGCSGSRGNVCSGDIIQHDTWALDLECENENPDENPEDELGFCRMPDALQDYDKQGKCTDGQDIEYTGSGDCVETGYDTFKILMGLSTDPDDNICNHNYRCAEIIPDNNGNPDLAYFGTDMTGSPNGRCKEMECEGGSCTYVDDPEYQCDFCTQSSSYDEQFRDYDNFVLSTPTCQSHVGDDLCDGPADVFDLDSSQIYCTGWTDGNIDGHINMNDLYSDDDTSRWIPSGEFDLGNLGEYDYDDELSDDSYDDEYFNDPDRFIDCCGDDEGEYALSIDNNACSNEIAGTSGINDNLAFCCDDENDYLNDFGGNLEDVFCVSECWYFGDLNLNDHWNGDSLDFTGDISSTISGPDPDDYVLFVYESFSSNNYDEVNLVDLDTVNGDIKSEDSSVSYPAKIEFVRKHTYPLNDEVLYVFQ